MQLVTQAATASDNNRLQETLVEFTPLLRADLKYPPRFASNLHDLPAFVDGKSERLFTVNVFASVHRIDGNFCVPVIRSAASNGVDIFAFEQAAVVFVDFTSALILGGESAGVVRVDIGYRDQIAELARLMADTRTSATDANRANIHAIAGRFLRATVLAQDRSLAQNIRRGYYRSALLQELSSREFLRSLLR
jgi:hypothetical protein